MSGLKRNGCCGSAFRTLGPRFPRMRLLSRFALHSLQRFGSFVNCFLVKEKLLTCGKQELSPAILTNQISINKIHDSILIFRPEPPASRLWNGAL
jgi:hypothetical protein